MIARGSKIFGYFNNILPQQQIDMSWQEGFDRDNTE